MVNCAIVIPCYNPTEFNYNIIKSYENLDPHFFDIFVVDNMSTNKEYIEKIKLLNIKYELSEFNGGYETGALYQVYKKTKYNNYFLVQDSIEIKKGNFFYHYSNTHASFALTFSPIVNSIERLYFDGNIPKESINKILSIGKTYDGVMCNAFGIKSYLLDRIFKSTLFNEDLIPETKKDSMAWESCWPVLFEHFKIPIEFLNPEESSECRYFRKINQYRQ
jgi:hypothetical protein